MDTVQTKDDVFKLIVKWLLLLSFQKGALQYYMKERTTQDMVVNVVPK